MRELNVVLPGLVWPDLGDFDYLLPNLKTACLSRLLSRGNVQAEQLSYSDCKYGLLYPCSSSLAAKTALELGVSGFGSYLLVEPTHLRIDRDRLLIAEAELLQLADSEAHVVIAALNQHFSGEFQLFYVHEELWLLGCQLDLSDLVSYPLIDIVGENIDDFLPTGRARLKLHSWLNEIQMLLFNLPLNQLRESEGSLTLNSVWLWDKSSPRLPFTPGRVVSSNRVLGSELRDISMQLAECDSIWIEQAYFPHCYRDSYAWVAILNQLEVQLFAPLEQALQYKQIDKLKLWLVGRELSLQVSVGRLDLWKFWRKAGWAEFQLRFASIT